MHTTRFAFLALALVAFMSLGCTTSTAPDPIAATIRVVSLPPGIGDDWPATPTITGGSVVTIRGLAYLGCSTPTATAVRSGVEVRVKIGAEPWDGPCVAITPMWSPFEAEITGLRAGRYSIRTRVVGRDGETRSVVNVIHEY